MLPTHRLVKDLPGFDFAALCAAAKAAFEITGDERTPEAIEARLAQEGASRVAFAVRVPGESTTTWFALKPIVDLSALGPPSLRKLDVTVLHGVILGSLLGIDAEALANQSFLSYTHDTKEAIARVAAGAQAAFFMNATKIDQILAVCEAGLVLPQKSTYFQPKLATGVVMYRLAGLAPRAAALTRHVRFAADPSDRIGRDHRGQSAEGRVRLYQPPRRSHEPGSGAAGWIRCPPPTAAFSTSAREPAQCRSCSWRGMSTGTG